jgi:hypothetical protein
MLREFAQYIVGLGKPNIHKVGELDFSDKAMSPVLPPLPHSFTVCTLTGLQDAAIKHVGSWVDPSEVVLSIFSPTEVDLVSVGVDAGGRRIIYAEADCGPTIPHFQYGTFMAPEQFIINFNVCFQRLDEEPGDFDLVLKIASNISSETISTSADDGLTQAVTLKKGISLKESALVKPLVNLRPYRTFGEIQPQIESQFLFRLQQRSPETPPLLALFEADGAKWKLDAMQAIKKWLDNAVEIDTIA